MPSQLDRLRACTSPPHHRRMRSTASTLLILTALTTIVSAVSVPLSDPQGTPHAPKAAAPPPLALPFRPHMPAHIPPWLIIVHLYSYHGPPRPATTRTRLQRAVQPRMPHRPDTPCCHVPYWRLCNMRVRPSTA